MRTLHDIDLQFHILYKNASRLVRKSDVVVKTLRICSRQARANHPSSTIEEYYRRSLAIPFLDHLESQIDTRFTASFTHCHDLFRHYSCMLF